jgi:hypothetical protein
MQLLKILWNERNKMLKKPLTIQWLTKLIMRVEEVVNKEVDDLWLAQQGFVDKVLKSRVDIVVISTGEWVLNKLDPLDGSVTNRIVLKAPETTLEAEAIIKACK